MNSNARKILKTLICFFIMVNIGSVCAIGRQIRGSDYEIFGYISNGTPVEQYTLTNKNGMKAKFITLGAALRELWVPDRNGNLANVVLNLDSVSEYENSEINPYFGSIVLRANRIKEGFTIGRKYYPLTLNEGENCLHGGPTGSAWRVWQATRLNKNKVQFSYTTKDGEGGFPGNVDVTVTYTLTDKNELRIRYKATTDKATFINPIFHGYFNLGGKGSGMILDHVVRIGADNYTPAGRTLITTGDVLSVKGTLLDLTTPQKIGARLDFSFSGYDHNYILRQKRWGEPLLERSVASVYDPKSGRLMKVYTTESNLQFYTGGQLKGKYSQFGGLCLEAQPYPPDAPNKAWVFNWQPLRPNEEYTQVTVYKFSTVKEGEESQ